MTSDVKSEDGDENEDGGEMKDQWQGCQHPDSCYVLSGSCMSG